MKGFCNDNPIFTKALSDKLGDVVYNPIADYYRFPKLCEVPLGFGGPQSWLKLRADMIGLPNSSAFVDRLLGV